MPTKIIYKQRHRDPCRKGRPYTTTANAEHLKYIGTREGVMPTDETASHLKYIGQRPGTLESENAANGLFGYINGAFAPSTEMTAAQGYIRNISKQHDIFRCCFSFTPDSAAEAGFHALADWQRFVSSSINKIAKYMEMKIENIEWYAAVHLKEGQPHVHIMYWDKEQKIRRNKVDPKICDNIRIDVIKDTYHSQFVQLREKENHLTSDLRAEVNSTANNAMLRNASDQNSEIVLQILNSLYRKLPSKGRLVYAFMPQEIKEELNAKLKIAVVGAQARIGTTSTAIHIADYFAHHKAAVAVIAADSSEYSDEQLAMICDVYDGEDKGDHYTVNGIDFYPNGSQPDLDYNATVFDFGVLNENNAELLSGYDKIYLVGGISWNEFPLTYQCQTLIGQYNYTILVNFCDNERLNAPVQIDGGSSSSYGRLLSEVNMQRVCCLPFATDPFKSDMFDTLFDIDFRE